MHPELRAVLLEACAREDCPPELRDSAAEYLSGAASRVPYPPTSTDQCWFQVWSGLSMASHMPFPAEYIERARLHLDVLKSPEP